MTGESGGDISDSNIAAHDANDRPDAFAALRFPKFRLYIASLLTLTLGVMIQATVVGWQMYELTRDPLALGMIGLAEALPAISMALYAGHVVDRHDRRRIVLAALVVLFGCSVALLVLAADRPLGVAIGKSVRITSIYAVIALSGLARAFLQPARQALGAELVPRALYPNAVTWRSGTWQVAAVLGPAIGGGLYALGGTRLSYAVDASLMLLAVVLLAVVRHRSPDRKHGEEPVWSSLTKGVRFVWSEPVLLGALSLDLFSVLFGGAVALLPIFAADILHVGPQGLGMLRAAPAVGAVVTTIIITRWPPFERTGTTLLAAVAGFGACMIGFGLSKSFALSVAMLAFSGAFDMVSVVVRSTLLQVRTPEHLLGRVSAVNQIFIGSSNEIGAFESGVAAKLLGTVASVVAGGVATLVVVATVGWRVPTLRRLTKIT